MKKLTMKNLDVTQNTLFKPVLITVGALVVLGGAYMMSRPDVGVIDFNAVQMKAKAYQSVLAEQKKYEDEVRTRMAADSVGLEKDAKQLESQKGKLKPEEFSKKFKALQKRAALIQSKYRPDAERIMLSSQIALKSIEKEIATAVEKTAEQTGVKVLLPMNGVLYAKKTVDLTDTFVKNLDKQVEKVEYPDPKKLAQ